MIKVLQIQIHLPQQSGEVASWVPGPKATSSEIINLTPFTLSYHNEQEEFEIKNNTIYIRILPHKLNS